MPTSGFCSIRMIFAVNDYCLAAVCQQPGTHYVVLSYRLLVTPEDLNLAISTARIISEHSLVGFGF